MSTLVRDFLFRVSTQLHDINPQFTRWTQRELVTALNDGQRAIAKYIPPSCSRVDAIKCVPGTKQSIKSILEANVKPGDGSPAANVTGNVVQTVIRNMGADGLTPGFAVRVVDREVLDSTRGDWHTSSGTPVRQFVFDPRFPDVFYVVPGIPSAGSWWLEVAYMAEPVEISLTDNPDYGMDGSNTAVLSVADKYVDDLMNYVLARAYLKDAEFAGDGGLAQTHVSLFTASINAQATAVTGVNPNLRDLPFNPNLPKKVS